MVWRFTAWLAVFVASGASNLALAQAPSFAPGVLTVIPPDPQFEETFSGPSPLVEIVRGLPDLDWQPHFQPKSRTPFDRAQTVILRRAIWNLEFAFKPMRTIEVDVPQPSGRMQKKIIWYMVYRVRYLGNDLEPEPVKDEWGHETFTVRDTSHEGRFFFPQFLLESHDLSKTYLDRIIPAAKEPIAQRELRGQGLLNSVEISREVIPLSTPDNPQDVWGLATWEDIDPRIDYFSVDVKGLTNAHKPVDLPDAFQPGDPPGTGRDVLAKTLRLNFWRPGDAEHELEDRIYYGVPYDADPARQTEILRAYGQTERLDHLWVYR
ncbi:MAG: hypothetical protein MUF48_18000 [Pirellulaceae bacterium]|jgi:hypothetical protein|nr:hypothetical protein [Pirellulaceae bacterium]